eukprot:6031704-Amphidinium_carterae.1
MGKDGGDRGKLLPELYVLGAQKSGTTEFAVDLMDSGALMLSGADCSLMCNSCRGILSAASQRVHSGLEKECACVLRLGPMPNQSSQEWHFFEYWLVDHDHYWQQGLAMEDWYNALPACDDIRFLRLHIASEAVAPNALSAQWCLNPKRSWLKRLCSDLRVIHVEYVTTDAQSNF